ncbi:MAG: FHA domain-containing protein [Chloroflexi bacterium]|nr:FHA domain-containing protein [Chloroflexota bacterium]
MVQLRILQGKRAGFSKVIQRFPCRMGRAPDADFRLEDDGVWNQHLELNLDGTEGFTLTRLPQALAAVNGQSFQKILLRNGDLIEIGLLKIQFWLSDRQQINLGPRELFTWLFLTATAALQVVLVFWLMQE